MALFGNVPRASAKIAYPQADPKGPAFVVTAAKAEVVTARTILANVATINSVAINGLKKEVRRRSEAQVFLVRSKTTE